MNKIRNMIILISLLIYSGLNAQIIDSYRLQVSEADRSGLVGNGITDLVVFQGNIFVGTGFGLSLSGDGGENWENFTPADYGGKGGISAINVSNDGTVWIATGYDTLVQEDESLSAGGGLRFRRPGSSTWEFIRQPIDAVSDTMGGMRPTTTHVQNVTYDIAILDTQIWITSFGGGVRRSLDMGQTWEVITTDGQPFSALDYLNHRGFSALADTSGNIWIGTAAGISKSTDGGNSWERYFVRNQIPESGGITGNWIIGMAHNPWNNSLWAVNLTTGGEEFNSVSRTLDGGRTWKNTLVSELSDGTFARNIAFYDSAIYVATEKGVYKSIDDGNSWYLFPSIEDEFTGERIQTDVFYSVATGASSGLSHRLWLGSADGLARTDNNGFSWTVFRSFVSTRQRPDPPVYAYPNPFSPERGTEIRFQYDLTRAGEVKIDIYNFAMEKVISIREVQSNISANNYDRSTSWDGRDNNGRMVDNGVYFFRAEFEGKVNWGKIVVVN